jgi:hypothetical protein
MKYLQTVTILALVYSLTAQLAHAELPSLPQLPTLPNGTYGLPAAADDTADVPPAPGNVTPNVPSVRPNRVYRGYDRCTHAVVNGYDYVVGCP